MKKIKDGLNFRTYNVELDGYVSILSSSVIVGIEFDLNSSGGVGGLFVSFIRGSTYRYEEVPEPLYLRFLSSKSKGKFFNRWIKGRFKFNIIK